MWLLIDDVRDLNADAIARTPEAGQRLLASGPWACLCLDHDLGTAQTGLDVLHWAIGHDCLPQRVQLVTTNLTARSKMAAAPLSLVAVPMTRAPAAARVSAMAAPIPREAPVTSATRPVRDMVFPL